MRVALETVRWPLAIRVVLAAALVALATGLRAVLDPILGPRYTLGVYLAATLAAGLLFNTVPAMVSLVLGGLAAIYFFIEPRGVVGMATGDLIGLVMYAFMGGLIGVLVDRLHLAVAARERAELAMARARAAHRQTEEEYRVAFELAAVGKAQSDPRTGRFLRVNDRFCALTGYTREELLAKTFRDITHPDDADRNWEEFERLVRGETTSVVLEKRYIRKDGEVVLVRVAAAMARDEHGRPWQVSATFEDVTARRAGEEALRRSQSRFAHLANAVPAFVWTAGPDGNIDFVNRRWTEYTGLSAADSLGRGWTRALHPDEAARVARELVRVRHTGEPFECEMRLCSASGECRWFTTRAEPVRDQSGAISAWFGTCVDIHESKLAQERLARSASELARSNADLENFAHIAAHDLKEPLRGIRLTTGFLREDAADKLGEKEQRNLQALDRLATRMHDLLDAMLEYSRVGHAGLHLERVELGRVVSDVVADLGPLLRQTHAVVRVAGPLPAVRCDPALVSTLLVNLITNAVKYNRAEERFVEFGVRSGGARPVFYVKDNGIGIRPDLSDHIFRMFKRLHRHDQFGGGTGAGLAIVKKIVERHGGRIWCEPASPDGGTVFFFTLEASAALPPEPAEVPGREEVTPPRMRWDLDTWVGIASREHDSPDRGEPSPPRSSE